MQAIIPEYPQYFTATNLEWKRLLKPDKYKDIVIESLKYMVENKRIKLFAFVIMDNHLHLIWQMMGGIKQQDVQRDFYEIHCTANKKRFGAKPSCCVGTF